MCSFSPLIAGAMLAPPLWLCLWACLIAADRPLVALDGHCAVCVLEAGKWVRGSPDHSYEFDGQVYYFPGDAERKKFAADPIRYAPVLGGDCQVCFAKMSSRVPGSIRFAATHKGRLYLFPGDGERKAFLADADAFADADIAFRGLCAVCLVEAKKEVPGKPQFTAVYRGLRYLFPSQAELDAFLKNPNKYAVPQRNQTGAVPNSGRGERLISVTGRSGCAACEFGVQPLQGAGLGFAVAADDGRVYVIEHVEQKHPDLFEQRFKGFRVQVTGLALKEQGKFVWLDPQRIELGK